MFWDATLSELYAAIVGKREFAHNIAAPKGEAELDEKFGGLLEMVRAAQRAEDRARRT